jgi:hypothetical protein
MILRLKQDDHFLIIVDICQKDLIILDGYLILKFSVQYYQNHHHFKNS